MKKYNLTFWQWIELYLFIRPMWTTYDPEKRKSWHEVKKGMEKHEHKFTIEVWTQGYRFLQCEHEGCRVCHDPDLDKL